MLFVVMRSVSSTMNKKQFVEAITHHRDDLPFIAEIANTSLKCLPKNYRESVIYRLYLKYISDEPIFKCVQLNGGVLYFGSMKDVLGYIKPMYPKAQKGAIYESARYNTNNPGKHKINYGHSWSYLTDKGEL